MSKITDYLRGSVEEMKKVTWPSKKEAQNYTFLVIGISLVMAAFLGALDYIFTLAFELLLK